MRLRLLFYLISLYSIYNFLSTKYIPVPHLSGGDTTYCFQVSDFIIKAIFIKFRIIISNFFEYSENILLTVILLTIY